MLGIDHWDWAFNDFWSIWKALVIILNLVSYRAKFNGIFVVRKFAYARRIYRDRIETESNYNLEYLMKKQKKKTLVDDKIW